MKTQPPEPKKPVMPAFLQKMKEQGTRAAVQASERGIASPPIVPRREPVPQDIVPPPTLAQSLEPQTQPCG